MKTITSKNLSLLQRTISFAESRYGVVNLLLQVFPLDRNFSAPLEDEDLALRLMDESKCFIDELYVKHRGEFLAAGSFYPAKYNKCQHSHVSIAVGGIKKTLVVFGDRKFISKDVFSDPLDLQILKISSEYAYGGKGFSQNPNGKGADVLLMEDGREVHPLPNIEHPDRLIVSQSDMPLPAGFLPLEPDLPQRAQYLGAFDDAWMQSRWPHLPLDTKPEYFQMAPVDQQSNIFWQGDESIRIENMHPDIPVIESALPGMRGRFFAVRADAATQELKFNELHAHLDTVWLLPDSLYGIAIYRAVCPCADPQGRDVPLVIAEVEPLKSEPLSAEYYLKKYQERISELLSQNPLEDQDKETEAQKKLAHLLSGKASAADVKAAIQNNQQRYEHLLQSSGFTEPQILQILDQNPQTRLLSKMIQKSGKTIPAFFKEFEVLNEALNKPLEEDDSLSTASKEEAGSVKTAKLGDTSKTTGTTDQSVLKDDHEGWLARQRVLEALDAGKSCAGEDISSANLSGLCLDGMDFSRALITDVDFSNASLIGCKFDQAFMRRVNFSYADLTDASLKNSGLSDSRFYGSDMTGCIIDGADCANADFRMAKIKEVSAARANFSGAMLVKLKIESMSASGARFSEAKLNSAHFINCNLSEVNFTRAELVKSIFQECNCTRADFGMASAIGCNFESANLMNSSADQFTNFSNANFSKANLDSVSWTGSNMSDAHLVECHAFSADFSDAKFLRVQMQGSEAKELILDRADASLAKFDGSNLFESSFVMTQLEGASLREANLYGSNFMEANLNSVNLSGAILDATILDVRERKDHA